MQALRRSLGHRLPRTTTHLAQPLTLHVAAAAQASVAQPALLYTQRRGIAAFSQPLLSAAAESATTSDSGAADEDLDGVPQDEAEEALYKQFEAEYAAKLSRRRGTARRDPRAGPGRKGIPDPIWKHEDLHGPTHRIKPKKKIIPAYLTPKKQGTGADFIPTLLRPVEWINVSRRQEEAARLHLGR
jgi:hypothetical protein